MSSSDALVAISTTFTPPATCTQNHFTMLEELQYRIYLNYPDPVPGKTITDCYPSQWLSSYFSQETATTALPAISPLVCPVGYETVTTAAGGYIGCCPSGFSLAPPTTSQIATRPAFGGTCYTPVSTVLVTQYDNSSIVTTSTWISPTAGAQAYAIPIEGFISASTTSASTSSIHAPSTSSSPTAAATQTSIPSTGQHNTSHSHAGAIAGGVVGGLAGLTLAAAALLFVLRRHSRSRRAAVDSAHPANASELLSNSLGEDPSMHEKDVTDEPSVHMVSGDDPYTKRLDRYDSDDGRVELEGTPVSGETTSPVEAAGTPPPVPPK